MSATITCPVCEYTTKDNMTPAYRHVDVMRDEWEFRVEGVDALSMEDPLARMFMCPCEQAVCILLDVGDRWVWFRLAEAPSQCPECGRWNYHLRGCSRYGK